LTLQPNAAAGAGPITNNAIGLLPNTPHQPIQFFVSGGLPVSGTDLQAMVGDGGPDNSFNADSGGVVAGPTITADLTTGTIFASNHRPVGDVVQGAAGPQVLYLAIVTDSGTVPASGLLATVFIDTTGWTHGTWELDLGGSTSQPSMEPGDNGNGLYDNSSGPEGNMLPNLGSNLVSSQGSAFVQPQTWFDTSITIVPEPSTEVLLIVGAIGAAIVLRRRIRSASV
jgi:hypothetical protein